MKSTHKIFLLLFFLLHPAQTVLSQTTSDKIDNIISDDFFKSCVISISVFDLTDNKFLYQKNEKLLLTPASNQKILTTAASLLFLGKDYKFETRLFHTGLIENGTLYGDLFIKGGLDPLFQYSDLDTLLEPLEELGIKKIAGNIFGDVSIKDSLYWGKGWMWDDNPDPTAVYLSALNINGNSVDVFVEGTSIDSPAVVTLDLPYDYFKIINRTRTVSKFEDDDFTVTRDWIYNPEYIIVDGLVPIGKHFEADKPTEKLNLQNPEKCFLFLVKQKLKEMKIDYDGECEISRLPGNTVYLNSVYREIDSVIYYSNKESNNLCAEMLLYALALNDSAALATGENGREAIERFIGLSGDSLKNFFIADGSGVSRYNLVSTELIINTFRFLFDYYPDLFSILYESLPVGGVDGTLKKRFKGINVFNKVHAKTGTLQGVSSLSGFINAENNHLVAFSILLQNYTEKSSYARNFIDRICEALAEYK